MSPRRAAGLGRAVGRRDRAGLTIVAALLVLAGLAGLLAGAGTFGAQVRDEPVFANPVGRYVGRSGSWLWPVLGLLGVLLALFALRYLVRQGRNDHAPEVDLERNLFRGSTSLAESAATGALTRELTAYRGVDRADAELVGDRWTPDLVLVVHLSERADLAAIRRRIETEGLVRFREALEMPELRARVSLNPH